MVKGLETRLHFIHSHTNVSSEGDVRTAHDGGFSVSSCINRKRAFFCSLHKLFAVLWHEEK